MKFHVTGKHAFGASAARGQTFTLAILLGGICACALAEPPVQEGAGENKGTLAGPKVEKAAAKTSLVERDFDGKVRRLEISPEEAAVKLLRLDGRAQSNVNAVIASRARAFDEFVKQNLDLLLKLSTATAANNKQDQGMLLREVYEKAAPIREQGRLLDRITVALPTDQWDEFKNLVEEYYSAVIDEELAAAKKEAENNPQAKKVGRGGIVLKVGFEQFGLDVKRAYERVISDGQGKLDEFVKQLDLSPEQDQKVRKLTTDFAAAHLKEPATAKEKAMLFLAISAELTPEQRGKLLEYTKNNK